MHLSGRGCKKCANNKLSKSKILDTASFVNAAHTRHGQRYDYSQVEYIHGKIKVKIICPEHGEFYQQATSHMQGQGCPVCARVARGVAESASIAQEFIERAIAVHGERYDYSQTNYRNSKIKVKILCRVHGLFEQKPHNHLAGKGCSYCSGLHPLNTESFIQKARACHGLLYDYTQANYNGAKQKLTIVCPHHGAFLQEASSHLSGCGCPDCNGPANATWTRKEWIAKATGKTAKIYLIKCFDNTETFYKVGITFRSVAARFTRYNMPYLYNIIKVFETSDAGFVYDFEKVIKKKFSTIKYRPAKPFAGQFECFSSCEEILSIFPL